MKNIFESNLKYCSLLYHTPTHTTHTTMKFAPSELKKLIEASYEKENVNVGKFIVDQGLSTDRVKVFTIDGSSDVVVVHRGSASASDWSDNLKMATQLFRGLESSGTYKIHLRQQKKIVKKYGAANIVLIGHSRGGSYASSFYKKNMGKQVITYNKPVTVQNIMSDKAAILMGKKRGRDKNETKIRTEGDAVSIGEKLLRNKVEVVVPSDSNNPVSNHSPDALDALGEEELIGSGFGSLKKLRVADLKAIIKKHKKQYGLPGVTGLKRAELKAIVESIGR